MTCSAQSGTPLTDPLLLAITEIATTILQRLLAAAGLEMRIRLEPIDRHDTTLEASMETLPPARQAELAEQARSRVEAERLKRVRGH